MTTHTARGTRLGALAIGAAGMLFALFPLLRPWADKSGLEGGLAEATGSPLWVAAHLAGATAFILLSLGALAVRDAHRGRPGGGAASLGLVFLGAGTGLTLLYFGAETFALHALATASDAAPEALFDAVRDGAAQLTVFALGLLLLAAGGILLAVAIWRGGVLPRTSALLLAAMIALYLPQFFLPAPGRIVHGVLLGIGALWLAIALWRSARAAH